MAKDYIDREVAIKICSDQYRECLRKNDWCGDTVAWNIGYGIKSIPAADVKEVVRCKDCKHLGLKDLCYGYCKNRMYGIVNPNDFCSYGERKE